MGEDFFLGSVGISHSKTAPNRVCLYFIFASFVNIWTRLFFLVVYRCTTKTRNPLSTIYAGACVRADIRFKILPPQKRHLKEKTKRYDVNKKKRLKKKLSSTFSIEHSKREDRERPTPAKRPPSIYSCQSSLGQQIYSFSLRVCIRLSFYHLSLRIYASCSLQIDP